MFKTIKVRLTVITLFILFVVFIIQLAANFLFAETYYINRKNKIMARAYQSVQNASKQGDDQILEIMSRYEDNSNLQFVLANQDLECIYNSKQYSFDQDKNKYKIKANFDFKEKIHLFSKDAKPILKEKKNNKDILILYGIIERGDSSFYVLIRTPLQAIKEDMYETNFFIIYVSGFALIMGTIVVYFFAKRTAKPIEEIDRIALNVTNLNFSTRASENFTKDEVGRLAKNINIMADKLESTIFKLKFLNEELETEIEYKNNVDKIRKEFVANVSHELKTPLSVLSGYAELLKDNINGIDQDFYYNVIYDEVQNMSNLVTSLLEITSIENGISEMVFEDINLTELVSNILYSNDILFTQKQLNYNFISDEHYYVSGNRLYLERAILNYLTNAIKYTEKNHSISVRIERNNKNIVLTIFNEGTSIDTEDLNRIWDRFYRTDKARTRDTEHNLGIGLYFVRTIMDAHNGKYGVRNIENGVEFWLSLEEIYT
jgi:signal transduction histidine kinase